MKNNVVICREEKVYKYLVIPLYLWAMLALLILSLEKLYFFIILAESLICYTSLDATDYKFCNEDDGYNTCFASYDQCKSKQILVQIITSSAMFTDGQVKERGCSTKHNICDDLDSSETACKKKPRHFLKSIFISNPFQTGSRSPGDAEIKRKSR